MAQLGAEIYRTWRRSAQVTLTLHPLRAQRYALSSRNPWLASVATAPRTCGHSDNPFRAWDRLPVSW